MCKGLKSKVYPHGNILNAGPKAGSSYTWQSIVAGIATFKRGHIWRVGNGESIDIWSDPWIPYSKDGKVISARGGGVSTKVSDLIDPLNGQWDIALLGALFNTVDVNRILQIPIHTQGHTQGFSDFVAWRHTSHGSYTVTSGCHCQWRHQFGASAGQLALPRGSTTNPVWKTIWKLKVASKVKKFVCRALHGILPLKSILINRHIGDSGECPICHLYAEDILHLLLKCEPTRAIWESIGLSNFITDAMVTVRSGSGVLEYIFCLPDNLPSGFSVVELKELVAVTCWYLWWIRCRRTHGDSAPAIYRCKLSILAVSANAAKVSKPSSGEAVQWSMPDSRWLKLNVDASFHVDKSAGAARAVIRDYEGSFMAAKCVPLPHVELSAMAEALAMRLRLELGRDIGCNRLIAESDSTDTIEACNGESRWNQSSAIYAECVYLIVSIGSVSFKICAREANQVAHNIARYCFSNNFFCNWIDEPTSFIFDSLTNDVIVL
jgi:hypothetical protein